MGFWPNLDQRPVRSASSDITEFEKCLIARIRFRRRHEEGSLALIWGRGRTSINRYIGEWAPQWGLMGRVLSELSIDEKYLQATCPAAYRSVGHGGVGSLLDGKDFLVESERKNNAIKNAQWSNKSSKSAFRVIVWSTPSGLIFEKTCAFLGRPSEGRLVRLWRSRLRKIPAGWSVLADRGFANDARLYPNLNAHITPHFLRPRQRTQFESAEVGNDQELSMLRYTSETIFPGSLTKKSSPMLSHTAHFQYSNMHMTGPVGMQTSGRNLRILRSIAAWHSVLALLTEI